MRIKIRLSKEDTARLNCPAELTVDTDRVSMVESITLQKGVELEPGVVLSYDSPAVWRVALAGRDLHGPDGKLVLAEAEDGKAPEPRRTMDMQAALVMVWLALRQTTGRKVELAGLEFDADAMDWEVETEDPADPGTSGKETSTPETTSPSPGTDQP